MSDACPSACPQDPRLPSRAGARMSARGLAMAAAAALLGGALVYAYAHRGAAGSAPVGLSDIVAAPMAGDLPRGNPQADPAREPPIRTAPRSNARAPLRAPTALRQQFEQTPDLYSFAQSLRLRAESGEAEAIWLLTRVYDYCANYSSAPVDYRNDTRAMEAMKLRGAAAMASARNRVSERCARFAPEDGLDYPMILVKRIEAAQAGSLAAEASLMSAGKPLEKTEDYRLNLIDRVVRSKDPEAFSALAAGMGIAANGRSAGFDYQRVSGTQFAELAWQLAACRLGQDCSAGGSLMTSYCANGGICSQDPQQDFADFVYDAAIPRQGAEVVQEMVHSLTGEERMK